MRLLFTGVAAYGHLLPLASLIEAAVDGGHAVALVTGAGVAGMVADELPRDVEHLPIGLLPGELHAEAARRIGDDASEADTVGEMFGGVHLDTAADPAVAAARAWGAEIVVSESYDPVGPLVAATLGLPWYEVGLSPAPPPFRDVSVRAQASRYAARGVRPVPATAYVDPWPASLRDPDPDVRGVPVLDVRARAHRRADADGAVALPAFTDPSRPTVLVTLGTIFARTALLAGIVDAVARPGVDVLATLGYAENGDVVTGTDRDGAAGEVRHVPFAPLDQLLDVATAVVGVAGSGTVLGSLTRGLPMVLWPQGGDHAPVAARATAAGVAVTVSAVSEIADAVTTVLTDPGYRERARHAAEQIRTAPEPREVLAGIVAGTPRHARVG